MNNWFALTTGGSNTWAVLEGVEVSPGAGTLRIEGQQPSVTTSMGVIDGGGDITSRVEVTHQLFFDILGSLTETQQLIWQVIQTVVPSAGTLRVVGQQPTLSQTLNQFVSPASFSLRLVGNVPTLDVTGDQTVSPSAGSLRFVGNIPFLEPHVVSPSAGTLRIAGQVPYVDLSNRDVWPTEGTLRIVGQGCIEKAQALTWTVFDTYVESTWEILWQRSAFVYYYQTLDWTIHSKVCATRRRLRQRRMTTAPRQRSMTLRATQRRIQVRSCANQ